MRVSPASMRRARARAAGFVAADRRIYVVVPGLPTASALTGR